MIYDKILNVLLVAVVTISILCVVNLAASEMTRGENGTLGPYGITKDGTPIFDSQVFTKEDVEKLQGGYGPGYGVLQYPLPPSIIVNEKEVNPCDEPGICGEEGPVGCSGNPNPPSDVDIKKFNSGQFTSRQGDIMIGGCYSPSNMAAMHADKNITTITICVRNSTETGPINTTQNFEICSIVK